MASKASAPAFLLRRTQTLLAQQGIIDTPASKRTVTDLALTNKGLSHGPGGRSSASGVTATVFGCTGFLGRYVTNALAQLGSTVVIPYRCDDVDMQHLRVMGDLGQIVQLRDFNIRDDEAIRKAISRSNVVVNLIGAEKETWNYSFEDVHEDAAARIAQIVAEAPQVERLMHVSCLSASEQATSRRLRTKAAGDKAVREAFPRATIFKPGHLVGVEDRLFNTWARLAKKLPLLPLIDGGHARLQPVWVRDVSMAMINSLKKEEAVGRTYHLAGPKVYTVRELVELVFETIREPVTMMSLPHPLAKLLAMPRELLHKRLPIPTNPMFTVDYADEMLSDHVLPNDPNVYTFKDLDVQPHAVDMGIPIEHIRHLRAGGYDFGTTGEAQSTGGAGFNPKHT